MPVRAICQQPGTIQLRRTMGKIKTKEQYDTLMKSRRRFHQLLRSQSWHPLPWLTYESIIWILCNTSNDDTIFEWGTGHGTTFWRENGYCITSVESSEGWAKQFNAIHIPLGDDYVNALDAPYDIVIVDGFDRIRCFERALLFASKYIVFDNAERPEYQEIFALCPDDWKVWHFGWRGRNSPSRGPHRGTGEWITSVFICPEQAEND